MHERALINVFIHGRAVAVAAGSMVSAALLTANVPCRISISGEPRAPFCGMGTCFECRAIVDGVAHQRTCQLPCREGMRVETQP